MLRPLGFLAAVSGGGGAAPPSTSLTWTSTSSDTTPNFLATFSATPDASDIFNIRVNGGATNTESLDAAQVTASQVPFELSDNGAGLADGSYLVECWLTRSGTDGAIGSATATIAAGTTGGSSTTVVMPLFLGQPLFVLPPGGFLSLPTQGV